MRRTSSWTLIFTVVLITGSTAIVVPVHAQVLEVHQGGSIQAAINIASPGDSIEVYAGTFVEQLIITKPLTIYASVGLTVTIQSPPASLRAHPVKISGALGPLDPIIQIHDTTGGALMGFVIDGNSQGGPAATYVGVLVYRASGVMVVGNEIKNIYPAGGISAGSTGFGIALYPGGSQAYALLQQNMVHDYNNIGITVSGQNSSALVYQNSVRGLGATPTTVQDGLQFANGGYGNVFFNTLSYNGAYTGTNGGVSAGIVILDSKGLHHGPLIQDNSFISNQVDVLRS